MPQRAFLIKEGLGAENIYMVVYFRTKMLAVSILIYAIIELCRKRLGFFFFWTGQAVRCAAEAAVWRL